MVSEVTLRRSLPASTAVRRYSCTPGRATSTLKRSLVLIGMRLPGLSFAMVPTAKGCGVQRSRTEFDTSTGAPPASSPSAKALRTEGFSTFPGVNGVNSVQVASEKPLR